MPIYEYKCEQCGHEMEALQKMSDDPLKKCPECEQESLKKKISAAAFRLKGGGWYETDFKSGNKKNLAGNDSSSGDKKPAEAAKKTETKASNSGASSSASSAD